MATEPWTPGPWEQEDYRLKRGQDWTLISGKGWGAFARVATQLDGAPNAEGEANAKLIVAAPDMAETLAKIAAGDFNCAPHQRFMVAQELAEAALAKARGQ